jgi:hypothetical protein
MREWCGTKPGPNRAKVGLASQVLAPFQFPLCQRVKEGQCKGYLMPKVGGGWVGWPAGHVYGWPATVWSITTSNLWWTSLTPPINTSLHLWGLASYSDPKFILCRVERERQGSEGRRTFWLVGSPLSGSSSRALPESIRLRWSSPSSSSVECGSSTGILWILTENRLSSPFGLLESWLV